MHKKGIYTCLIRHLPSQHTLAFKDANMVISGFKGASIVILPNSFFFLRKPITGCIQCKIIFIKQYHSNRSDVNKIQHC